MCSVSVATTAARFNIGNLPDPLLKRAAAGCQLATYIATEGEGKKKSEREREIEFGSYWSRSGRNATYI